MINLEKLAKVLVERSDYYRKQAEQYIGSPTGNFVIEVTTSQILMELGYAITVATKDRPDA